MPQMSPMPWIVLLILTLMSLITISSIIYFSSQKKSLPLSFSNKISFNLKW